MGAISKVPPKPEILVLYEGLKKSGLPLVAGGYVDQPYLISEYLEAAQNVSEMMDYLNERALQQQQGSVNA